MCLSVHSGTCTCIYKIDLEKRHKKFVLMSFTQYGMPVLYQLK